jgi:hypothetical protein
MFKVVSAEKELEDLELYHLPDRSKLDIFEYDIVLVDVLLLILGSTHRNKELVYQKQAKLVDQVLRLSNKYFLTRPVNRLAILPRG